MIPNIHIHERLMFERCQERQHAAAQQRMAAGLRRERYKLLRRFLANIAGVLVKLCTSLKQLEAHERQVTYDR